MLKKVILFVVALAGTMAIGYILLQTKNVSFTYTGFGVKIPVNYPIIGIDISHHQGDINFDEVVNMRETKDSVQFVYIKSTEGSTHKDRHFDKNAEGFAAYKMKYGFYHYYQPNTSAILQADFFCETIKGYNFKLIPVIDIEVKGALKATALVDSIEQFMNRVEEQLQVRPMIYTFISFYNDYLIKSKLQNELFWLASYSRKNEFMNKENILIWQFTEKSNVDGIGTNVDMNAAKQSFNKKVVLEKYRN